MELRLNLPKKYLSYSAYSLWKTNKNEFRRRYYEGESGVDNAYTIFGREIAEALESGKYPKIRKFKKPEHKISAVVNGVPLLGYLDSFSPTKRSFLEYKTGIRKEDGSDRWTQSDVEKHLQLPFYAMLVEAKYGRYFPRCRLIWLETQWKTVTETVGSQVMETDGNELELTGYAKEFIREIYPKEIEALKTDIKKQAILISEDYTEYLKTI